MIYPYGIKATKVMMKEWILSLFTGMWINIVGLFRKGHKNTKISNESDENSKKMVGIRYCNK